jgi:hypothetical protein
VAVYLFVQSVLPTWPAVLYVFAAHPYYAVYAHQALGLNPLADQRLAGVLSKVGTLPVLWSVAWAALARAYKADRTGQDPDLLQWLDVERRLQRAERRQHRVRRRPLVAPRPGVWTHAPTVLPPGQRRHPEPPPPAEPPAAT